MWQQLEGLQPNVFIPPILAVSSSIFELDYVTNIKEEFVLTVAIHLDGGSAKILFWLVFFLLNKVGEGVDCFFLTDLHRRAGEAFETFLG